MTQPNIFSLSEVFTTERGDSLHGFQMAYHTYGTKHADGSNVVWVVHALTANSDVSQWWDIAFGPGKALDPGKYFIVCAHFLGAPYGSTSPSSTSKTSGAPYLTDFPQLSPRDLARSYALLALHLGLDSIRTLIGPSFGGQQALEWAILEPQRIQQLVLIATNAQHSAFGKAFNAAQRMAIESDPSWNTMAPEAGRTGLITARAIAMLSYRSYSGFEHQQDEDLTGETRTESYLRYQGAKLADRFPALHYWYLSKSMDLHDIGRGRPSIAWALQQIESETLVVNIESDILFPYKEQELLARHIKKAVLHSIVSNYGHDGFLIEPAINELLNTWMERKKNTTLYNSSSFPY